MDELQAWDLWWAYVKFEDIEGGKERPVVILETGEVFVLTLPGTSHEERNIWGEYDLVYWQSAGLSKPTTIRTEYIIRLRRSDLRSRIGRLHPYDILRLSNYIG